MAKISTKIEIKQKKNTFDKTLSAATKQALQQAGKEGHSLLRSAMLKGRPEKGVKQGINSRGSLYRSSATWKPKVEKSQTLYTLSIKPTGERSRIYKYIEFGRSIGKRPTVGAIQKWLSSRGFQGYLQEFINQDKRTKVVKGVMKLAKANKGKWNYAYIIARKIGREGVVAREYMVEVKEKIIARIPQLIKQFVGGQEAPKNGKR